MRLSIRVRGELVRQGLEDLSKEIPDIGRRRMRGVATRVMEKMRKYPPKRPGQKYRRTYNLRNNWKAERYKNDKGYTIRNAMSYAHYPVGDAYGTGQAWMHKGRWPLFRDITEQELKELPEAIQEEIVMVARREGFACT